jgi:hypothetical protein
MLLKPTVGDGSGATTPIPFMSREYWFDSARIKPEQAPNGATMQTSSGHSPVEDLAIDSQLWR